MRDATVHASATSKAQGRRLWGPRLSSSVTLPFVRISYDPSALAIYIYLTREPLLPGRRSVECDEPETQTTILDWKDGKLVGIEMLNADRGLQGDLRWKDELPGSWITYDPVDDTAYIYLVDDPLPPGRDRVVCDRPGERDDPDGRTVIMDWKDGKLIGIEVPAASSLLHADLLAQAYPPRAGQAGPDQTEA
jgi:uncharacterized protein YuzE